MEQPELEQLRELFCRIRPRKDEELKATSFALKSVLEQVVELQCFTAEEKFRQLLKRSPHVLNPIPHKYLASYMG
ncbi:MAG: hypothetical protein ACXVLT_04300 [Flavisolibacter sp.]